MARRRSPRRAVGFAELPLLSGDTLRQLRIAGLSDSEVQNLIEKCAAVAAAELMED
jgi:thiamine monophosphate synthase